jgi:hypothetical protein
VLCWHRSRRLRRAFLEATADGEVRVRPAVTVHVERPVTLVLAIATATVQARVTTVEIPVIRDIGSRTARRFGGVGIVGYERFT